MAWSFKAVKFTVLKYINVHFYLEVKLTINFSRNSNHESSHRLFQKGTIEIQSILRPCIVTFKLNIKFKTSVV